MDAYESIYNEGVNAHKQGFKVYDNPYPNRSTNHIIWFKGFADEHEKVMDSEVRWVVVD